MTSAATSPLSVSDVREVTHQVYVRYSVNGSPAIDGERDGWVYDPYLRCDYVRQEAGPRIGVAEFTIVPESDADADKAFDALVRRFSINDQVRVIVQPVDDELQAQPDDEATPERVLFEGRIARIPFTAQANEGQNTEGATLMAKALSHLDNDLSTHQILGRWMAGDESGEVRVLDGFELPAVFNYRDRPNMDSANAAVTLSGAFTFNLFTNDDDADGMFWTVRLAIGSLLGQWLYGSRSITGATARVSLPRFTYIEAETLTALADAGESGRADRWVGLDDRLPETRVHGMGLWEALEAICEAAGFQFAVVPDQDPEANRPHVLKLWRKNSGELVTPALAKRGASYVDGEAALAANDTPLIKGMVDGAEIINEVTAMGRVVIESVVVLRPLWSEDEIDGTSVDATLQAKPTEDDLAGSGYFAKHVPGGVLYEQYKHVGRRWGVAHRTDMPGHAAGSYAHGSVFDWVGQLGINNADSLLRTTREAAGVTQPIWWAPRLRLPLKLKHPTAVARGLDLIVEVSEDNQATWYRMPWKVKTLPDAFGIDLADFENLTRVNLATLGTKTLPDPSESWWALMKSGQLWFALTAGIPADHGDRYNALRQPTSGSTYRVGRVVTSDTETRFAHSSHALQVEAGVTETWQRIETPGFTAGGKSAVQSMAERMRDDREDCEITAALSTWIMDFGKYQLGQQVQGLRGRNFSFAASAGAAGYRYPNIVGITYQLGAGQQGIQLSLADHRMMTRR